MDLLEKDYSAVINKLSFIKIDTEGYDKEIIKLTEETDIIKWKNTINIYAVPE